MVRINYKNKIYNMEKGKLYTFSKLSILSVGIFLVFFFLRWEILTHVLMKALTIGNPFVIVSLGTTY